VQAVRRVRRTLIATSVAGAAALSLLGASPAGAVVAPSAVVAPRATLAPGLDTCLRSAVAYPGGMLVYVDARLSASQVSRMQSELWARGRRACVLRAPSATVAAVTTHWAQIPAVRRPDTVLIGVRGTVAQAFAFYAGPHPARVVGSSDSGFAHRFTWPHGISGVGAADRFLVNVGELTIFAGSFSGTSDSWLVRSSVAQCARAAAAPNGVLVLGDSITYRDFAGLGSYLSSHGLVPCVLAQRSARVEDMLRQVSRLRIPVPKNIIVALGNNDVFSNRRYRYQLYRVQQWAGSARNVVWTTIWRTRTGAYLRQQQFNARVVNQVATDVGRLRSRSLVVDWYTEAVRHPGWLYDGIHLTSPGLNRRYSLFVAAVKRLMASPA
jgi:hypothetical protein